MFLHDLYFDQFVNELRKNVRIKWSRRSVLIVSIRESE